MRPLEMGSSGDMLDTARARVLVSICTPQVHPWLVTPQVHFPSMSPSPGADQSSPLSSHPFPRAFRPHPPWLPSPPWLPTASGSSECSVSTRKLPPHLLLLTLHFLLQEGLGLRDTSVTYHSLPPCSPDELLCIPQNPAQRHSLCNTCSSLHLVLTSPTSWLSLLCKPLWAGTPPAWLTAASHCLALALAGPSADSGELDNSSRWCLPPGPGPEEVLHRAVYPERHCRDLPRPQRRGWGLGSL